ncbi:MAG: 50S ribosomal protein L28 [Elusimicrobia bacterium]|nr:50S ribosomal protein L28 [Elusimicrobiota bacterium]
MLIKCAICGKHATSGNKISHSHKVSKQRFHVNLQKIRIKLNGQTAKKYVCTQCIRSQTVQKA